MINRERTHLTQNGIIFQYEVARVRIHALENCLIYVSWVAAVAGASTCRPTVPTAPSFQPKLVEMAEPKFLEATESATDIEVQISLHQGQSRNESERPEKLEQEIVGRTPSSI